ncbi:MAG TPA: HEPN domain-containing protein [Verrucomicrobiae bacterium]|jgi:HEPN domain-containing protein
MKPLTREWIKKAENDFKVAAQILQRRKDIVPDAACFFCQQCVEKYLKAKLVEAGISFQRTHDLLSLLNLCVQAEPLWTAYAQIADDMTDFAVDFRYPGHSATLSQAKLALKHCRSLRAEVRRSLGLKKLKF